MGESFLLSEDEPLSPNIDGAMALWIFRRRAQTAENWQKMDLLILVFNFFAPAPSSVRAHFSGIALAKFGKLRDCWSCWTGDQCDQHRHWWGWLFSKLGFEIAWCNENYTLITSPCFWSFISPIAFFRFELSVISTGGAVTMEQFIWYDKTSSHHHLFHWLQTR